MSVYVSPSTQAKLGHAEGECVFTRTCAEDGVLQGGCANASCSLENLCDARREGSRSSIKQLVHEPKSVRLAYADQEGVLDLPLYILSVDDARRYARAGHRAQGDDFRDPEGGKGVAGRYRDTEFWLRLVRVGYRVDQVADDADTLPEGDTMHGSRGERILSRRARHRLEQSPRLALRHHTSLDDRPMNFANATRHPPLDRRVRRRRGPARNGSAKTLVYTLRASDWPVGSGQLVPYGNKCWYVSVSSACSKVLSLVLRGGSTGVQLRGVTRLDELRPERCDMWIVRRAGRGRRTG